MRASDEALMLEFQGGSSAAFEELFARYHKPLCGFFGRRLNNPERAEDLTQETFLAVIRAASRYEPRALVRTYLLGIALKLLAAERRKFLTSSPLGQSAPESKTDGISESALSVRQALEKLTCMPTCRYKSACPNPVYFRVADHTERCHSPTPRAW